MEHKITTERILEASNKCKQAKEVLETLFPEVFIDNTHFCNIGDTFVRKGHNSFYRLKQDNERIYLENISTGNCWTNSIVAPFSKLAGTANMNLTRHYFNKLTNNSIDEFIVVRADVVCKYYQDNILNK